MYTIDSSRTYDWASYCGIPGGIPNRTTVYRTLTAANSLSEINAAIQACPSGQVVALAEGEYSIGQITFGAKSGVTLRGAGPGKTIISASASPAITASSVAYNQAHGITVSSGYTKDSTAIVLSSTPTSHFAEGNIIIIDEAADPDKWDTGVGTYYRTGLTTAPYDLSAARPLRHTARVTSVVGNTVNLATPLPVAFTAGDTPTAYPPPSDNFASLCGVEGLTIDCGGTRDRAIMFTSVDRCWAKDVEIKNCIGTTGQIYIARSTQCEVRRCYIHDTPGFPTQADGYSIMLYYGTSNALVVDCIGYRVASLGIENGGIANCWLYNYVLDASRASSTNVGAGINNNHGPHGLMNLIEGNIMPKFSNDGYHGSTSHATLFRNSLNGIGYDGAENDRRLVNLCRGSYYHNVLGNIIGDSTWEPYYYDLTGSANYTNNWCAYALGYPGAWSTSMSVYISVAWTGWSKSTSVPDADVSSTIIRHANYDYYNDAVVYGDDDHTIADSLFYDSKPDFFGGLTWPAIDPFTPTVNDIPAKFRWDTYAETENLDDIFYAAYEDEGIVSAKASVAAQSSATGSVDITPPQATESFSLEIEPTTQQVRKPDEAAYFVTAHPAGGYANDIALSVLGLPAGGAATFDANPIASNGTTTLRIDTSGIGATDPDDGTDYNLTLKGIESP